MLHLLSKIGMLLLHRTAALIFLLLAGTAAGETWDVYPRGLVQYPIDSTVEGNTIYGHAG